MNHNFDLLNKYLKSDIIQSICPNCKETLDIKLIRDNIPYFGDIIYLSSICNCNFRYNDTILLSVSQPSSYELQINEKSDLNSRVIKSNTCTIIIKELEIIIEPGSVSNSYITNIEGIIRKILNTVTFMMKNIDKKDEKKLNIAINIYNILKSIIDDSNNKIINPITIILKDPLGNSKIINKKTKYSILNKEDIEKLNTGMNIIDINNIKQIYKNNN